MFSITTSFCVTIKRINLCNLKNLCNLWFNLWFCHFRKLNEQELSFETPSAVC